MAKLIRVWDGTTWQTVGTAAAIGEPGANGTSGADAVYDTDQAVISMQVFS
jgi:hypothetical protein